MATQPDMMSKSKSKRAPDLYFATGFTVAAWVTLITLLLSKLG